MRRKAKQQSPLRPKYKQRRGRHLLKLSLQAAKVRDDNWQDKVNLHDDLGLMQAFFLPHVLN